MAHENKSPSPAGSLMTAPGTAAVTPERLEDITVEVERLCGAVRRNISHLAFGDEPSAFAALLERRAR